MSIRNLALVALCWAANAGAFIIPSAYTVVEYVNEGTSHYVLAANGDATLDNGGPGGRWTRTGFVFTQYYSGPAGENPVCHFRTAGTDKHFYTPYAGECDALKQPGSGWTYEGTAFFAPLPTANGCPATTLAVHRLTNGMADHRYSAEPSIIAGMLQQGWYDEGIGFCAYAAGVAPEKSFVATASGAPKLKAECEATVGPCIALAGLAPMTTRIPPYLPPNYIEVNDAYPPVYSLVGGNGQDVYTARAAIPHDVLDHSFFMNTGGIRIVGYDRVSGPYAGMHLMYQLPLAGDERVFPWRNGRERDLVIASSLSVKTLTRTDAASDAYGLELIQFTDRVSGRSLFVTLQAFGISPGGDFIGRDFTTGWAIVSTSFRDNPLFGDRLMGNYTQCNPSSTAQCVEPTTFMFQLAKADFQAVLGHARTMDAALSANPADYFVASFRQHNETYLDAAIGMGGYRLSLEVWPRFQ